MQKIVHSFKQFIKWSIISLVLAVIGFCLLVTMFFPLQRVMTYVTDTASKKFGRQITVKDISFNVFKGVQVMGFQVANDKGFSRTPLVAVRELWLTYDLRALLLERRILISKVDVNGLELLYEKNQRGDNISGMFKKDVPKKDDKNSPAPTPGKKDRNRKKEPVQFRLRTLAIRNSSLEQRETLPGKKRTITVSGIDLTVHDISSDLRNLPITAKGMMRISIGGESSRLGFTLKEEGTKRFSIKCAVDSLAVDKVLAAFATVTPKKDTRKKKQKTAVLTPGAGFAFLQGYDLDISGTVSKITWEHLSVPSLKFKALLHDMQLSVDTDALAYAGTLHMTILSQLSRVGPPFTIKASVKKIEGGQFVSDMLGKDKAIEGILNADVALQGTGVNLQKLSGSADATFTNGALRDSSALLPGIPDYICTQLNGKMFDLFYMKLVVKNGKPSVGALKAKGEGLDIDQTVNLDMNKLRKQVGRDISKEKKRLQGEVDKELEKKKSEAAGKVEEMKSEAEKNIMEQMKKSVEK